MVMEGLIASLLVGKLRGGKFSRLGKNNIDKWGFFVVAALIHISTVFFNANNFSFIDYAAPALFLIAYVFLMWGIVMNIKKWPLVIILLGILLNFVVVAANDGRMPISLDSLRAANLEEEAQFVEDGRVINYSQYSQATKLGILAKTIAIKPPYPLPQVLSIGDIVVTIGLILYIQYAMTHNPKMMGSMLRVRVGTTRRY